MRKVYQSIILFCFFVASVTGQKNDIQVFEKKQNAFGLINRKNNKVVLSPRYLSINPLLNGLFVVKNSRGLVGVVSAEGLPFIPEIYDGIKFFGGNLFEVQKNEKWGLLDFTNKQVLPIKYDKFTKISEDLYEFSDGSKKGYITKYGYILVPADYDSVSQLTSASYLVSNNNKWGVLDNLGKTIIPIEYDAITKSSEEEYFSLKSKNKEGLIDRYTLKVVVDPLYDSISADPVGFLIKSGDKIGFFTKSGKLIKPQFTKVMFEQPEFGLVVVKEGDKLGFITSDGFFSLPVYDNISRFSNRGIAFVEKNGKLQAVDLRGNEMTLQDLTNGYQTPPQ